MVAWAGQTEARIITVTLAPLCTIALRFRESSMRKKLEIFGVEKGREVERSGVLVRQTGSANYRKTPDLLFFPAVARQDAGAESIAAAVGCTTGSAEELQGGSPFKPRPFSVLIWF